LLTNRTDHAELLLQHGAKENLCDAVHAGHLKTASALIEQDPSLIAATNGGGTSLVDTAALMGHADILKLLLDKGALAEAANAQGAGTPLHLAAMHNQTNTAQLLIGRGADVEAYDRFGFTPLHWTALQGSPDVAVLLLQNKAKPDTPVPASNGPRLGAAIPGASVAGDTALHFAAMRGDTNFIQLLLKSGASVNTANAMGRTPLDLASQPGLPRENFLFPPGTMRWFDQPRAGESAATNPVALLMVRQKAAATMLEAAGGKHAAR
jgi:ankyrin repeat protein